MAINMSSPRRICLWHDIILPARPCPSGQAGKKSGIKGLGSLGAMVLSADKDLEKFLKPEKDEIIEGNPICIIPPDKTGKFRNELRNLIIRLGTFIIEGGYEPETIQIVNERLNQLVEKYRLPEIADFKSDGESYINFLKLEIPNPAKPPARPGVQSGGDENMEWLGLDIQVSGKIS